MNGLSNITVNSFDVPGDAPGQLNLVINATIDNPSEVSMHVGDIDFDIVYETNIIGSLSVASLSLIPGLLLDS